MRKFGKSMTMMRAFAGAATGVMLSLATLGAAAAPASAAANLSYFLTSGTVAITSGGHTWSLNVSLIGGSSGGPVIVDVLIETPHLSGTEIHDWGMQMPGADFTVNKTTGAATINSHSDLSPVASLNLSYKPTAHTAGTCSAGSQTDYTGTLTGSVTLTTGLKGLKLSDAKAVFSAKAKSLTVKGLASGAVTGAGVVSGAKLVVPGTETCALGGKSYTQTSTSYNGASWSSSTRFRASTILTGTLKVATTGSGEFDVITLKA